MYTLRSLCPLFLGRPPISLPGGNPNSPFLVYPSRDAPTLCPRPPQMCINITLPAPASLNVGLLALHSAPFLFHRAADPIFISLRGPCRSQMFCGLAGERGSLRMQSP